MFRSCGSFLNNIFIFPNKNLEGLNNLNSFVAYNREKLCCRE